MSKETTAIDNEPAIEPAAAELDSGFGAEFRELARQRRFQREEKGSSQTNADPRSKMAILDQAAQRMADANRASSAAAKPAQVAERITRQAETAQGKAQLSDENAAMLAALTRATERYVDVRAELATTAEKLSASQGEVSALNQRLMAARALVIDAQNAMHESSERSAWLEGRNEMLQEALELAVHASLAQRWKWRREAKKRAKHADAN